MRALFASGSGRSRSFLELTAFFAVVTSAVLATAAAGLLVAMTEDSGSDPPSLSDTAIK